MKRHTSILLLLVSAVLLSGSTAMAGASAPEGRTYFIYIIGLDDNAYETQVDCLTFDTSQACSLDDQTCLTWQRTQGGLQTNRESGFSLAAEIDDDGLIITMEGQGRVDSRGSRSSISAVARAAALDMQLNFSLAGRQVGKSRCRRMVEDFQAQTAAR